MQALRRQQIHDPSACGNYIKEAREHLEQMKQHKEAYSTEVLGECIVVHSNVFSPKYMWDARFHIENMVSPKGKKVLDVGTGTGAVALFCALRGATLVHAVDITESAVTNAQENFASHHVDVQQYKVHHSDLFSNVNEKFDIIHFNPPLCDSKAEDDLEKSAFDEGYSTTRRFMAEVGAYLEPDGRVCMIWSNVADIALMIELIEQNGYQMEKFFEEHQDGFSAFLMILKRGSSEINS